MTQQQEPQYPAFRSGFQMQFYDKNCSWEMAYARAGVRKMQYKPRSCNHARGKKFLTKQGDSKSGEYRNLPERALNLCNKINYLLLD